MVTVDFRFLYCLSLLKPKVNTKRVSAAAFRLTGEGSGETAVPLLWASPSSPYK